MEEEGLKPQISIYSELLFACAKKSDLRTGLLLWKKITEMAKNSVRITSQSYRNVFWLLASDFSISCFGLAEVIIVVVDIAKSAMSINKRLETMNCKDNPQP